MTAMKYQPLSKLSLKDRRGYTLLFSVIVSVLVLSVAAFILSISRKQFILSSAARDSVYAFYASDSGIECAIGRLSDQPASPISTSSIYASATGGASITIQCGGMNWPSVPSSGATARAATTTWNMPIPVQNGSPTSCAIVSASYYTPSADGTGATSYYITSLGYNIGWDPTTNPPSCSQYGPRRVERALRYTLNF